MGFIRHKKTVAQTVGSAGADRLLDVSQKQQLLFLCIGNPGR